MRKFRLIKFISYTILSFLLVFLIVFQPVLIAVTYAEEIQSAEVQAPPPSDQQVTIPEIEVQSNPEEPIAYNPLPETVQEESTITGQQTPLDNNSCPNECVSDTPSTDPSESCQLPEDNPCCPSQCPAGEVVNTNQALDTGNVDAQASSGNEIAPSSDQEIPTDSETPTNPEIIGDQPEPENSEEKPVSGEIKSGDANAQVEVVNQINTNLVDSTLDVSVKNISEQTGDIDLSKQTESSAQLSDNLKVTNENSATNSANISVTAESGNTIEPGVSDASIQSGDANVFLSAINLVNTNFVDSTLMVYIINIFGEMIGNIILPEEFSQDNCGANPCQLLVINNNFAFNSGNITLTTTTGNEIGGGVVDSQVISGEAQTFLSALAMLNTNIVGGSFYTLIINNFGDWDGSFLGWGNVGGSGPLGKIIVENPYDQNGSENLADLSGPLSVVNTNTADSSGNINVQASTGNKVSGDVDDSHVTSGNASIFATIFSMVNTNLTRFNGFWGVVNIFGKLTGSIGGVSKFATDTTETQPSETQSSSSEPSGNNRLDGGALSITNKAFVGPFIYPGDTVTFELEVKNTGTGPVYDSHVQSTLYNEEGKNVGSTSWDLGTVNQAERIVISFGMTLSPKTPEGNYINVATISGSVNHDPKDISVSAESNVFVKVRTVFTKFVPQAEAEENSGQILGENQFQAQVAQEEESLLPYLLSLFTIFAGFVIWLRVRKLNFRQKFSLPFRER